ncbi:MAG: trigger factor [Pleurocapsa sp. SU_196_0]|nr:trigger factor [Pleurocapsa sp. SU_196_0]
MAELLERNGNKVKFKVVVPAAKVSEAFTGVMNALSRQVRIDGFRPGKAPKSVIEKRVGAEFVKTEVAQYLVEQNYTSAVQELKLIPVQANVTPGTVLDGADFEFTVDAENYPEVTLPNWEAFTLESTKPSVGPEDMDKALEEIRQSRATYEQVDRAAAAEDVVNVEILEGEDTGKTYPVYLERAEAGVRNALLGQNVGAEVEVTVSENQETGETTLLKVKILDIKEKRVPELNDDFAKLFQLEGVDTLDAFKERVQKDLEVQSESKGKADRRDEFVKKLGEGATIEVPEVMIQRRREAMEQDLGRDLEQQGITLEAYKQYLQAEGKLEEFEKDLVDGARNRVRNDLALEQLSEAMGAKLTDEEWKAALDNYARSSRVSVPRLIEALGNEGVENFRVVATRDKALEMALTKFG